MDNHTTIEELKQQVKLYCDARDWAQFHTPKELAIGVVTEAAELLEPFRFKSDEEITKMMQDPAFKKEIENELADVLYFLLRFADLNNIDLTTAFKNKLAYNEERYPVHKSKGSNKKYDEL